MQSSEEEEEEEQGEGRRTVCFTRDLAHPSLVNFAQLLWQRQQVRGRARERELGGGEDGEREGERDGREGRVCWLSHTL